MVLFYFIFLCGDNERFQLRSEICRSLERQAKISCQKKGRIEEHASAFD